MTLHRNARTCPRSRRLLAERVLVERWSLAAAAEAAGVSKRTAWKWVDRFRAEGVRGLEDRSSAPQRVPGRTPNDREQAIVCLRELRFTSPEIAESLGMPLSTVGAVLSRYGLGKLPRLRPEEPANSYQRPRPGELVHACLQDARHPPPAHPAVPAAHERESRTFHPHPRRRLGLRRRLPHERRANRRTPRLARLVQPTQTAPLNRPTATTQPPPRTEQRSWDQQLDQESSASSSARGVGP